MSGQVSLASDGENTTRYWGEKGPQGKEQMDQPVWIGLVEDAVLGFLLPWG